MRQLVIRGAGATVFSQAVALGIQVIATVVLARLLTPRDFGVVTMVTTFSLLLMNFGLNGFTEAVLQRAEVDEALVSNLFWINVGIGILLTIGFTAAGSLLARFFGNPLVAHAAAGISLTIVVTSASVQHLALLKRAMRFSAVSANDVVSRAVYVVVSTCFARAGWGYRALVAGIVAQALALTIGAWSLCRWIPRLPRRAAGTGALTRFAMNVYGRFSVNYFARNMDNLLVGWRFNAQALGFYKKAYDLFALSASQLAAPLVAVAVSALSRLYGHPLRYRRYLLRGLAVMAFVGMGLSGELTLVGKDVTRLLLGPGWGTTGRIFTFFGPGIGIMLVYGVHSWIHLSIGRADRWFRWGMVEFGVTGVLFLLGLRWGPEGIAVAWTVSFWILTVPAFWYAGRPIQLGVAPVFAAVWRYILASGLAAGAPLALVRCLPSLPEGGTAASAAARIAVFSVLFGILYLGAVILLHRGSQPIREILGLLAELGPGRRPLGPEPAVAGTGAGMSPE